MYFVFLNLFENSVTATKSLLCIDLSHYFFVSAFLDVVQVIKNVISEFCQTLHHFSKPEKILSIFFGSFLEYFVHSFGKLNLASNPDQFVLFRDFESFIFWFAIRLRPEDRYRLFSRKITDSRN